jgi:hypothetical protein
MADRGRPPSRRALLGALTAAPIAASLSVPSPWSEALASLHHDYGDDPATLTRTRDGRGLSLHRYHIAEEFLPDAARLSILDWRDYLYSAGVVAQLGLSSHLLDVGFDDQWCARHIGYKVAKSLAYANATGLGHDDPEMARLALVLTPYWQWNALSRHQGLTPDDGGFAAAQVGSLLRTLLDHVHEVTGHPRPDHWDRKGGRHGL